ncbi:MAG: membrane protein insertase YidC [Calditrichaeota bacterium]|nr:membrane protein insertase YidC [Calditrichota bacterium]MCB9369308.1 membrane protein insertase YidC [Calditrichota bacterium]
MFDRNTLIALVLVGLILLGLPYYYKLISPPAPPEETVVEQVTKPRPSEDIGDEEMISTQTAQKEFPADTSLAAASAADAPSIDSLPAEPYTPELVEIETPLYKMSIGSDGRPTSYVLEDYKLKSGPPVNLHAMATPKDSAIGSWDVDLGPRNVSSLRNLHFNPSTPRLFVPSGRDSLELNYTSPSGQRITIYYVVDAEKYGFDLSFACSGFETPDTREYKLTWQGGVPSTEPDPRSDHDFGGAYAQVGEELEDEKLGSDEKVEFSATGRTEFVATRSKYFIAAMIPQSPAAGADMHGYTRNPKDTSIPQHYYTTLRMPWEGSRVDSRVHVYWGPIKKENLEVFGVGLENTMNWGWAIVKPFSLTVLWLLKFFGKFIHNYGFVIILFSLIVKVVLWPLTRKSQIAMKKMAALKPELEALKEKHAKNPQALNGAMMALYKERGVNPAAGCIPMLFQMPILYGLFIVFRSTIEFRQAPFFGWISDLSQPDAIMHLPFSIPLYGSSLGLLPIVMGVSQFFMSKATMTDPNQKAMIYIMPVMMVLLFNNFPSGLTLYYTLFNLWAIVEQRLIKLPVPVPEAVVVEDKPKKKGKK